MKTTIVAVTCAFCAAACASSNPPAQDPTSVTAEATTPAAPSQSGDMATNQATSTAPSTTTSTTTSAGSTSMMGNDANQGAAATPPASNPSGAVAATPSGTDPATSPDNTKVNVRDRQSALTPINQGNSASEIKITATVRKGVMGDHTLSFTAKNVKIITVGTKVTLRGPVNTDAERTAIENLARQTAGVTDVDDQLEVKTTK